MFLNISPTVTNWSQDGKECSLIIDNDTNPFTDFVQLPDDANELWYTNIIPGIIRGALEMVHMEVECKFLTDVLKGHDQTELRVKFVKMLEEEVPMNDD